MLTNLKLLNSIAKQKKFTFISTGMSKMSDVENAVKIFKKYKCKFNLMHCVSAYPCLDENLNLKMIEVYKKNLKLISDILVTKKCEPQLNGCLLRGYKYRKAYHSR